jgi:hypothetical protein
MDKSSAAGSNGHQTKLQYESPTMRTISSTEILDKLGPAVAVYR